MIRRPIAALSALLALAVLSPAFQAAAADQVIVPRGGAVEIAVVLPMTGSDASVAQGDGAWNAVRLAVEQHSRIKGFAVQLNRFDGPCDRDTVQNAQAASDVVANPQNVAVIGHFCSPGFSAALPAYQSAGIVTISGSATSPFVPTFGPDVFNSVAISDSPPFQDNFDPWYAIVSQLPEDIAWRQDYQEEFGAAPPPYADLYYDAASLLLDKIASTARRGHHHSLVIDRAALAHAVRATTGFDGATCDVTLASNGYRVNDPVSLASCASPDGRDLE